MVSRKLFWSLAIIVSLVPVLVNLCMYLVEDGATTSHLVLNISYDVLFASVSIYIISKLQLYHQTARLSIKDGFPRYEKALLFVFILLATLCVNVVLYARVVAKSLTGVGVSPSYVPLAALLFIVSVYAAYRGVAAYDFEV